MKAKLASRLTACAAAWVLLLLSSAPAAAQHDADMHARHHGPERTVSVSGEGSARVAPDQATVRFSVVTEARSAEAARERNADASSAALNAARELVPEENVRLETLRLQPRYDYDDGERELIGYEATRAAVVRVEDLDVLPTLVARIVQRGANRLDGVEYDVQDRAPLRRDALQDAAADARAKASVLARSLGAQLGRVLQISEERYEMPQPRPYAMMRAEAVQMDAAPSPDAYAGGEIEVTATVQVRFALE